MYQLFIYHTKYEVIAMDKQHQTEELKQLLRGTYIGISVFENLKEHLKSKELKEVFAQILDNFKTHERALAALVIAQHEEVPRDLGMQGKLSQLMQAIKSMTLASDKEILSEALKALKMADDELKEFTERHYTLREDVEKTVRIMQDDYAGSYHMLHKFSIEFR